MIKISANLSKKVPLPGVEFSSQQYGAAMEIEVSDADQPAVIQQRIRELYALLCASIDEQITGAIQYPENAPTPAAPQVPVRQPVKPTVQQRNGYATGRNRVAAVSNGNGNGSSRRVNATEAQCRAIYAICKSQGIDMTSVLADFNVADAKDLHVKDASRLIDQLKNGNGAAH